MKLIRYYGKAMNFNSIGRVKNGKIQTETHISSIYAVQHLLQ